jgi:hypothetical protein
MFYEFLFAIFGFFIIITGAVYIAVKVALRRFRNDLIDDLNKLINKNSNKMSLY